MHTNDQHEAHKLLFALLRQENVNNIVGARRRIKTDDGVLRDDERHFLTQAARSWRPGPGSDLR